MIEDKALTVSQLLVEIGGYTPEQREALRRNSERKLHALWLPDPDNAPQMEAYYGTADETLYGGAAGGGKTDLLCGLAVTRHQRSVIFRRQSEDLGAIWDRLIQLTSGHVVKSDATRRKLRMDDGRFIELGHLDAPNSEKRWQGNPHDLYGFDEAAQLDEHKVHFVIQWLRSTLEGLRKRIVFGTNPPVPEYDKDGRIIDTSTGAWLKDWFAPWLDDMFENPAVPGELRWCYMRREGDRLTTVWVEGPGGYHPTTGARIDDYTDEDVLQGRVIRAISRTFIKALLQDNRFLKNTGYAERLSSTPEPLKSLLLTGSFSVKGEDHPMQVIPTNWVLLAQQRWKKRVAEAGGLEMLRKRLRMLVLFADIAQGGADTSVLAPLLETDFFDELLSQPGSKTPGGKEVVAMLLTARRNNALLALDGGGGWGGSTRDKLTDDHQITPEMLIPSEASHGWTDDGRYKYLNMRTEIWWEMRKALDPKSTYEICLPPNTRLATQLTAPIFFYRGKTIVIEDKDALRTRVGGSTDEADAVLGAHHYRDQALGELIRQEREPDVIDRIVHGRTKRDMDDMLHTPQPLEDPLKSFR